MITAVDGEFAGAARSCVLYGFFVYELKTLAL